MRRPAQTEVEVPTHRLGPYYRASYTAAHCPSFISSAEVLTTNRQCLRILLATSAEAGVVVTAGLGRRLGVAAGAAVGAAAVAGSVLVAAVAVA